MSVDHDQDGGTVYLSDLLGLPVRDGSGAPLARLQDLIIRPDFVAPYPPVTGIVARLRRRAFFIPWEQVARIGPDGVTLASATVSLEPFRRREGEVLLARDVLDKQLVDVEGRRVVRANDLELAPHDGLLWIVAVDVGPRAILRRVLPRALRRRPRPAATAAAEAGARPAGAAFHRLRSRPAGRQRNGGGPRVNLPSFPRPHEPRSLIDWADLEPFAGQLPTVKLKVSHERLARLHPVDIARIVDHLSYPQGAELVDALDPEIAADTLEEMSAERQADILEGMDEERAADILEEMGPDEAADVLADLPEQKAESLLDKMDPAQAEDVRDLMQYDEDTAGGMMTTELVVIPADLRVGAVLRYVREQVDVPEQVYYLYVVDSIASSRLAGVLSLRDLLLADPEVPVADVMETDLQTAESGVPARTVARTIADYNLLALPVVDADGRLLGAVTVDDAMELLLPEGWKRHLPRVFG